jgi:hypothetical protein
MCQTNTRDGSIKLCEVGKRLSEKVSEALYQLNQSGRRPDYWSYDRALANWNLHVFMSRLESRKEVGYPTP